MIATRVHIFEDIGQNVRKYQKEVEGQKRLVYNFTTSNTAFISQEGVMPMKTLAQHEERTASTSSKTHSSSYGNSAECFEQYSLSAITAWLKSIRIAKLLEEMRTIDFRRENAMEELRVLTESVEHLISTNRGGDKGIHGFIGERAQVYLCNAWELIKGQAKICELIDDNGMTDYLEKGIEIQQKACRANGWLGLDHVFCHHDKYPEFHGKYQIPLDFYEEFRRLENLTKEEAGKLRRHDWNLWKEVQKVKQAGIEVEPMRVTYREIQRDSIYGTIDRNKDEILAEAESQKNRAIETHRPTVGACIKTAVVSSATEGLLTGSAIVFEKCCEGKSLKEFDSQDLKDVGLATAEGSAKGAIRGAAVYITENCTPVPGVIAGSAVTVAFEGAKAVKQCYDGNITKEECVYAIEKSVLVATAGGVGAKIGGKLCPIPIIGEVVGGFVFSFIASKSLDEISGVREPIPNGVGSQTI